MNSGASKGAYILHKKLLANKINSFLINDDEILGKFTNTEFVNNNLLKKIRYRLINILNKLPKVFYLKRKSNAFDNSFIGFNFTKYDLIKKADIIHLHWINKSYSNISYLEKLKKPVVWTLRDMWAFTGGCHYALECTKYKQSCGRCISLKSKFTKDISYWNQKIKKENNKEIKINYVAISKWLKGEATKSLILKNKNIKVIYNGVDNKKFFPIIKNNLKNIMNIPTNKKIILFGSQYINSEYKGFQYLLEALKYLKKQDYFLITFGKIDYLKEIKQTGIEYKNFGFINDDAKLRKIYNLADIFIASSTQEAFGKTIVESLLCGTPVVCFKKTAVSEIVSHKKNGYCSIFLNSKSLANGIKWVSKNYNKFNKKKNLQKNKFFKDNYMTRQYISLYRNILKNDL